jgi:hypothetical protein
LQPPTTSGNNHAGFVDAADIAEITTTSLRGVGEAIAVGELAQG